MATISIEKAQTQARALLDSRIESVTALVKARQRVADLKEQLAEAEKDDKRAYVRATKDGWSADELKKLGLENSAVGRRRTANRKSSQGAPSVQQEAAADSTNN
jgi:hypothetical protein